MRQIIEMHTMRFAWDDSDIVGFEREGMLELSDSNESEREGDIVPIRLADIWSWIHNGDRSPVTLYSSISGNTSAMTFYPHYEDDMRFLVVKWKRV